MTMMLDATFRGRRNEGMLPVFGLAAFAVTGWAVSLFLWTGAQMPVAGYLAFLMWIVSMVMIVGLGREIVSGHPVLGALRAMLTVVGIVAMPFAGFFALLCGGGGLIFLAIGLFGLMVDVQDAMPVLGSAVTLFGIALPSAIVFLGSAGKMKGIIG